MVRHLPERCAKEMRRCFSEGIHSQSIVRPNALGRASLPVLPEFRAARFQRSNKHIGGRPPTNFKCASRLNERLNRSGGAICLTQPGRAIEPAEGVLGLGLRAMPTPYRQPITRRCICADTASGSPSERGRGAPGAVISAAPERRHSQPAGECQVSGADVSTAHD